MRRLARLFAALGLALGMAFAPTTVRAQTFVSPFIGYDFGGDAHARN